MGWVLLAVALIAAFTLRGVQKTSQQRLDSHGIHSLTWRWLTGEPWHGKPVTNAGWRRRGTPPALTRTGFAARFYFRPRWERAVIRTGGTLIVIITLFGYLVYPSITNRVAAFVFAGLIAYADRKACRAWLARELRRAWVEPVHAICAPLVRIPIAAPTDWLAIESGEDHAVRKAVFELPSGQDYSDPKWKDQFIRAAAEKLGIEAPEPRWELAGPMSKLTLVHSQPPPRLVELDEVWEYVEQAGPHDLIFGLGKKRTQVSASLVGDSPHGLISMGSGAGKSNLAAFLLLQELRRGAIGLVLDAKWFSHPWLMDLPSVAYARSTEQLHTAMCWLLGELERRTRTAAGSIDYEGRIHASVGPRLIILAEEMNLAEGPLKQYWADIRDRDDPKRSPAFTGIGAVAFAGRQVGMHLIAIGQMLSARVLGGGEVRENMGIKCLSRYSPNAWKMMAPEHAMPPPPWAPGRIQLASAAGVRETQVPLVELPRARYEAMAGRVGVPRHDMPYVGQPRETVRELTSGAPDQPRRQSHAPDAPPAISAAEPVGLREAVEGRIIPVTLSNAHNIRDRRRDEHPSPVGRRGLELLYDPDELARFYTERSAV